MIFRAKLLFLAHGDVVVQERNTHATGVLDAAVGRKELPNQERSFPGTGDEFGVIWSCNSRELEVLV